MTCSVILHETATRCPEDVHACGLCSWHDQRRRAGWPEHRMGAPRNARKDASPITECTVVEHDTATSCGDPVRRHDMCGRHNARFIRGWSADEMGLAFGVRRYRWRKTCHVVLHLTGEPCGDDIASRGLCQLHRRRVDQGWAPERLGQPPSGSARCGTRTDAGPCRSFVASFGHRCSAHPDIDLGPKAAKVPFAPRPLPVVEDRAAVIAAADEQTAEFRNAAETARIHTHQWRWFTEWAGRAGIDCSVPVPFETVACYLAAMTDPGELDPGRGRPDPYRLDTIAKAKSAIREAHLTADVDSPTDDQRMRALWRGIRRTVGHQGGRHTPAITPEIMAAIIDAGDRTNPEFVRDAAAWLLAWHRALDHCAWSPLRWGDHLNRADDRWNIHIDARNAGPDVPGRDLTVVAAKDPRLCAVRALDALYALSRPEPGDLAFPSTHRPVPIASTTASQRLKKAIAAAGIPEADSYSPRSLVEGFYATAIAAAGATTADGDDIAYKIHLTTGLTLVTTTKRVAAATGHQASRARDRKIQVPR